ncbi:hypothetical protein MRX96_054706 [Rhipicephalus microplus]
MQRCGSGSGSSNSAAGAQRSAARTVKEWGCVGSSGSDGSRTVEVNVGGNKKKICLDAVQQLERLWKHELSHCQGFVCRRDCCCCGRRSSASRAPP